MRQVFIHCLRDAFHFAGTTKVLGACARTFVSLPRRDLATSRPRGARYRCAHCGVALIT
jgi:hypothetical protein